MRSVSLSSGQPTTQPLSPVGNHGTSHFSVVDKFGGAVACAWRCGPAGGGRPVHDPLAVAEQIEIERAEVRMPEGPIQEVGDFTIGIHLHSEVNVEVPVKVVGEE